MGNLSEGSLLQNRYTIKKILGKGAMGKIYLAHDSRLSDDRAIKEMNPSFLEEEEKDDFLELFKQEAHILSRLHHLNLPKVIDYFFEGGRYYLVMDYIHGENLKEYVEKQSPPVEIEKTRKIISQICDVLSYLHNQKPAPIIFRDLKPSNIMIMPDLTVKLIDFGIARIFKDSKKSDTVIVGTPGFAPPEQYGKRQTDEKSDIYSLGATLYYIMTGHIPDMPDEKGKKEVEKNPLLAENLKPVILKCLSPVPENRYTGAEDFRKAFMESLEGSKKIPAKTEERKEKIVKEEEMPVNTFFVTNLTFLFMLLPSCILAILIYLVRLFAIPHLRTEILLQILCFAGSGILLGFWIYIITQLRKISGYNWQIMIAISIIPVLLNGRNIFTLIIPEWGQQTFTIMLMVVLFILMYIASIAVSTFFRYKKPEMKNLPLPEKKKDLSSYIGKCGTVNSTMKPSGNIIVDGEEKLFSACTTGGQYIEEGKRVKITGVKMGDLVVTLIEDL